MPIGLRPRPRRAASFKRFLCAIPPNILLAPISVATGPRKEISALHAKVSRNKYPHKARIGGYGAKTYASDSFLRVVTVYFRRAAAATPISARPSRCDDPHRPSSRLSTYRLLRFPELEFRIFLRQAFISLIMTLGLSELYEPRSNRLDGFVRRPNCMREKRKVDQRGSVAVAPFGMLGCGGRIFRDCYLETLLDQFARRN